MSVYLQLVVWLQNREPTVALPYISIVSLIRICVCFFCRIKWSCSRDNWGQKKGSRNKRTDSNRKVRAYEEDYLLKFNSGVAVYIYLLRKGKQKTLASLDHTKYWIYTYLSSTLLCAYIVDLYLNYWQYLII